MDKKIYDAVKNGTSDNNIKYADFQKLVLDLGFEFRRQKERSKMLKYSVLIQYDNRDNIYVASIPELQGCMVHGKTPEDAIKEIRIASELWLKTAEESNSKIPESMVFAG